MHYTAAYHTHGEVCCKYTQTKVNYEINKSLVQNLIWSLKMFYVDNSYDFFK